MSNPCWPFKYPSIRWLELPRFVHTDQRGVLRYTSCICYVHQSMQSFLLHSYDCCSRMFGLSHRLSAFSHLVSQATLRLAPCWHFSVQVNQRKFIVLQLYSQARIVREHVTGKVAGSSRLAVDVGHRCYNVATTEVIKLQWA